MGLRATFLFLAALPSTVTHDQTPRAGHPAPGSDAKLYIGPDGFFTGNFEFHDLKRDGAVEWLRWGRLRARDGRDPAVELIAIADGLPPAALKLFDRQVPLSSLMWQIDIVAPELRTDDGWWLLHAESDTARAGFSSQRMAIWNAAGEPVARQMQSVAIFA